VSEQSFLPILVFFAALTAFEIKLEKMFSLMWVYCMLQGKETVKIAEGSRLSVK
jgi:hypothetical protein